MKVSIRWAIILGSIVLVWGTHLIITPSSYIMSERVLTRHMQDVMENISDLTLEQSYNHLSKAQGAASLAKQLLSSNVVSSDIDNASSLERYFFDQLSMYPHLSSIYVGGLNGNFFMVGRHTQYDPDGFRTKIIRHTKDSKTVDLAWRNKTFQKVASEQIPDDKYDPRTRPWFKAVMEHKHIAWTDPYVFYTAQKPGVTIAGPAFDENGNLKGIVGVDIEISELSTFISKLRVGKSGKAFIMNRNGDIIAYNDLSKLIVPSNNKSLRLPKINEINDIFTQAAFNSIDWQYDENKNLVLQESVSSTFTHEGEDYLSMFTPFPQEQLPWIIGVYVPEDDYLGLLKSNRLFNIIVTIVISILASFISLIFAQKLIRPIESLAAEAKAIKNLDLQAPVQVKSMFNEIQEAADSFSHMKASLAGYEDKLKESDKLYQAIAKTANDAIVMMDHKQNISFLNPAAERMFGYLETEAVGMPLHTLLSPKRNKPLYEKGMTEFSKHGSGPFIDRTVNVIAINKVGTKFPVELSLSSLQIDGNWHAVAIIRDITERKKAEQLRKRLAHDLHDGLGGSLTNIKLFSEMTMAHDIGEPTKKNLDAIASISEDCLVEIRNYMNILEDSDPNWDAFLADMHQYCAKNLEPHEISFSMTRKLVKDAPPLSRLLYINILKIVKEAVTNIIKHSNANNMILDVQITDKRLCFVMADNGTVGVTMTKNSGRGLLSMTSRTKELGGTINIYWDNGLIIKLDIPLSREMEDINISGSESALPDEEINPAEIY